MLKFFQKNRKQRKIKTISIIITSLVLAFVINFYYLNNNPSINKLQANILNTWENSKTWDFYLEKNSSNIVLKNNKTMKNVKEISLSLAFNPENISINNINLGIWWNLREISNETWIITFLITQSQIQDLGIWTIIFDFQYTKKTEKLENINIVNANFTDWDNQAFWLSSSWIEF